MSISKNSKILITGGTGSFGKAFLSALLKKFPDISRVVIFSRDELKQSELQQNFPFKKYPQLRFFLGDIRDLNRLKRAFEGVDTVIHAAALKQVRLIAVLGEASPRRRQSVAGEDRPDFVDPGRLPMVAFEANIAAPGGWAPGVPLDLTQEDFARSWSPLDDTLEERGWRPRESFRGDFGQRPVMSQRNRILDAALWPLAHPVPWLNPGETSMSVSPSVISGARRLGGGLRLGSPGLMVVGFLDDVPAPGAPSVDGEEPTSSGTVLVRAFLPLPVKER